MGKYIDGNYMTDFYPFDATPGDRFVFFLTLFDSYNRLGQRAIGTSYGSIKMGRKAYSLLYTNSNALVRNKNKTQENSSFIKDALNWLKAAADMENSKEKKLLIDLQKDYPQLASEISIAVTSNNYFDLINAFNLVIDERQNLEDKIKAEKQRIIARRAVAQFDKQMATQNHHYVNVTPEILKNDPQAQKMTTSEFALRNAIVGDDLLGNSVLNPYFNIDISRFLRGFLSESSEMGKLMTRVLRGYGVKIVQLQSDKEGIEINPEIRVALLTAITTRAYQLLNTQYKGVQRLANENSQQRLDRLSKGLDDLINDSSSALNETFNYLTEDEKGLQSLMQLAKTYKRQDQQTQEVTEYIKKSSSFARRIKSSLQTQQQQQAAQIAQIQQLTKEQQKQFDDIVGQMYALIKDASTKSFQCQISSEPMSLMNLFKISNTGGSLGAGAQTTSDIFLGRVNVTSSDSQIQEKIMDFNKSKFAKNRNKIVDRLKKVTDLSSYKYNNEQLAAYYRWQESTLTKIQEKYTPKNGTLTLKNFNIHTTVKGYASIDATTNAFKGARFGTTIQDQVDIIYEMLSSGGITLPDKDWLLFALINCGKYMIGGKLKPVLENYLSIFAGLLMFQDSAFIAQDVQKFMQDQFTSNSSYEIHLYDLNTFLVPNSFMLYKTYEYLSSLGNFLEHSTTRNQGTHISLKTYDKNYKTVDYLLLMGPDYKAWHDYSNKALENTKLTMTFLAGFLDFIEEMEYNMGNLFK